MARGFREQLLVGGIFLGSGIFIMALLYGYSELSQPPSGIEGATPDRGIFKRGVMPSQVQFIIDHNGCVTNCEIGQYAGVLGEFCVYDGVPGVIAIPNIQEGRVGTSPGYCPVTGGGSVPVTGKQEQNLSPRPFEPNATKLIPTPTPVSGTIYDSTQNQAPQGMKCIKVGGVPRWGSRHDSREAINPSNCLR